MEFQTIETPRLILRKLTPEVYDFLYANYSDQEIISHLGLRSSEELDIEKEKHKKGLSAYDRTILIFQLIEKKSNTVMGMCGFVRYYPTHFRAEFGYSLNEEAFKNKGYMSEAAPFIIEYGFQQMNLTRIEAMVGPTNIPSLKIIEKLGFEREGLMKKHFLRNGVFENSVVFALFKKKELN